MPRPLDPHIDFQDDGGTPEWRQRQAEHARIIGVAPRRIGGEIWYRPLWPVRLWRRWWAQPFHAQAIQVLFVGGVLPYVIIFGGLILVGVYDRLVHEIAQIIAH